MVTPDTNFQNKRGGREKYKWHMPWNKWNDGSIQKLIFAADTGGDHPSASATTES
jgi:hypothetical protein